MNDKDRDRFMSKVDRSGGEDACWTWLASVRIKGIGYGQFWMKGRNGKSIPLAHRISYEHFIGPIPDGFDIDHVCRNPYCVNPKHLEAVTHLENVQRGEACGKKHFPETLLKMAEKRRQYWAAKKVTA